MGFAVAFHALILEYGGKDSGGRCEPRRKWEAIDKEGVRMS